eukprot:3228842-Pyramimonas_sp.AAC.1
MSASWEPFGVQSWTILGHLWAILGPLEFVLGACHGLPPTDPQSCAVPGHYGRSIGPLQGRSCASLEPAWSSSPSRPNLEPFWVMKESSC